MNTYYKHIMKSFKLFMLISIIRVNNAFPQIPIDYENEYIVHEEDDYIEIGYKMRSDAIALLNYGES